MINDDIILSFKISAVISNANELFKKEHLDSDWIYKYNWGNKVNIGKLLEENDTDNISEILAEFDSESKTNSYIHANFYNCIK